MSILGNGGGGVIGSHKCVGLLNAGGDGGVVDTLYNAAGEGL